MVMDIELEIEGVADRRVADAIRRRVRLVRQQFARPGAWRVMISPSERRGEWDLGVRTPSGWHVASSTEPADRLPDVIEQELRERLQFPLTDPAAIAR
jgi:hypothetical protein